MLIFLSIITLSISLHCSAISDTFSDTIQVIALGALRGMQDVLIPTLITFISYWIIGFPISFYLSMYTEYKSAGIWIGLLAGLTASGVLLFIRFNHLSNKMILTKSISKN